MVQLLYFGGAVRPPSIAGPFFRFPSRGRSPAFHRGAVRPPCIAGLFVRLASRGCSFALHRRAVRPPCITEAEPARRPPGPIPAGRFHIRGARPTIKEGS